MSAPQLTPEPMSLAELKQRLKDANLRATSPRVAVLRLLSGSPRPLSHSEVVQALQSDDWDQATLYRNLIKLTEANLTRVASEVSGIKRYELGSSKASARHLHPHFVCSACGEVSCLPKATITQDEEALNALGEGWLSATAQASLHFMGTCPGCVSAS